MLRLSCLILLCASVRWSAQQLREATCYLQPDPASNQNVQGFLTFTQEDPDAELDIYLVLDGFDPPGPDNSNLRGFYIHEYGDVTGGCSSTGGHFNPKGAKHGAPNDKERHVGDFGNIEVDSLGRVDRYHPDTVASLFGVHSIVGRAIVALRQKCPNAWRNSPALLKSFADNPDCGICAVFPIPPFDIFSNGPEVIGLLNNFDL